MVNRVPLVISCFLDWKKVNFSLSSMITLVLGGIKKTWNDAFSESSGSWFHDFNHFFLNGPQIYPDILDPRGACDNG